MNEVVFRLFPLIVVLIFIILTALFRWLDRWSRKQSKYFIGESLDSVAKFYGIIRKGTGPWWFILRQSDYSLEHQMITASNAIMIAKYILLLEYISKVYYGEKAEILEKEFEYMLNVFTDTRQLPLEVKIAEKRGLDIEKPKV